MKKLKTWTIENPYRAALWSLLVFMLILNIEGCASPNPNAGVVTQVNPATGQTTTVTNPPYIPNTTGTAVIATGNQVAPLIPPPYGTILNGVLAIAAAALGLIAKSKNDQATAANATATQLATSVAAQGPTVAQAVIQHASNSAQAAPVFAAVNAALPPDPVAPPKNT